MTRTGGWPYCADCDPDKQRKLAAAVRLAADAVVKAAERAHDRIEAARKNPLASLQSIAGQAFVEMAPLIEAHRKALAEQAKEASRG